MRHRTSLHNSGETYAESRSAKGYEDIKTSP